MSRYAIRLRSHEIQERYERDLSEAEKQIEQLQSDNAQLKAAILKYGNNPAGFDWAVLEEIEKLKAELEAAKKQASFTPAFVSSAQNYELAKVKAELAEAREYIRYAIGGIDALLPDNADAGAIKTTLELALKVRE